MIKQSPILDFGFWILDPLAKFLGFDHFTAETQRNAEGRREYAKRDIVGELFAIIATALLMQPSAVLCAAAVRCVRPYRLAFTDHLATEVGVAKEFRKRL